MASNTRLHSNERLSSGRGEKYIPTPRKTALLAIFNYRNVPLLISTMKKYICVLASAALLAACEQKTETTQPATTPAPTAGPEAASASSLRVALEARLFVTVSGAVCEKLCVVTSMICETAFGLC